MFTAVNLSRASQAIVEQIRGLLREGKLRPGDRLPSERELCQQFGVSRVTVREALRILETGGLVLIRVGARGGAFVTSPTSRQVGTGLADLVSLSTITAAEVTEARLVFELGIVPLIVSGATDDDIAELRALTKRHAQAVKAGEYSMQMSAEFHTRLAGCTHNAAIEMLVHTFHGPLLMSLLEVQAMAPLAGRKGCAEHAEFVEAVAARDAELAESIMRTHIGRTATRIKAHEKRSR
ncbi:FadR/GntR family transcriptional regulator [Rugosimonospora acidiphila]|uniref:FadR/GntR family transcriptional regulator n=2 Tax=Rugosimonospora acidiphila TaxID=556531 RepID=A0ABP9SFY5_9ACTN